MKTCYCTARHWWQRNENVGSHKSICTNIYRHFTHNSQKMEAKQIAFDAWGVKLWHMRTIEDGQLKNRTARCDRVDQSLFKLCWMRKKATPPSYILYDPTYTTLLKWQKYRSRTHGGRGRKWWGGDSLLLDRISGDTLTLIFCSKFTLRLSLWEGNGTRSPGSLFIMSHDWVWGWSFQNENNFLNLIQNK